MKKLFFLLCLSFVAALAAEAQNGKIKGRVSTPEGAAVHRAVVQLLRDSTLTASTESDERGAFQFSSLPEGHYRVRVSYVGLRPVEAWVRTHDATADLGDIVLLPADENTLSAAVVQGARERWKDDYRIIYPSAEEKKRSMDGYTLVRNMNLPKIEVNPVSMSVTSFGKNVTLCINNREVGSNEIRMLDPKRVLRIEYHEHPTGEFYGKDAVINYILKPQKNSGRAGLDLLQVRYAGNYLVFGQFASGPSELSISGSPANYYSFISNERSTSETFSDGNENFTRRQDYKDSRYMKPEEYVQVNYNYYKGKHLFNVSFGYKHWKQTKNRVSYALSDSRYGALSETSLETPDIYDGISGSLFYRFQDKKGNILRISNSYYYSKFHNDYLYTADYADGTTYQLNSPYDSKTLTSTLSLYYVKRFRNKWSYILNGSGNVARNQVDRFGDMASQTDGLTGTGRAQTALVIPAGRWQFDVYYGFAADFNRLKGIESKTFFTHMPKLNARYSFPEKGYIHLSGEMYNTPPSFSQLQETVTPTDELQVTRGNPLLKDQKAWRANGEFNYQVFKGNLVLHALYLYMDDVQRTFTEMENGTFVHSYRNAGTNQGFAFSLGYYKTFFKSLSVNGFGQFRRVFNDGPGKRTASLWNGHFNVNYFYKNFNFGANLSSTFRELSATGAFSKERASLLLSVGYMYKRLSVLLAVRDFWKQRAETFYSDGPYYSQWSAIRDRINSQTFFVRVSWNLSFGKQRQFSEVQRPPEGALGK